MTDLGMHALRFGIVAMLSLAVGCGESASVPLDAAASEGLSRSWLISATSGLASLDSLPRDPRAGVLHADSAHAARILEGYLIGRDTRRLAPDFVGNELSCFNCHLNGGQRERALPLTGVAATFPQYRGRDAEIVSLYERIAGCFRRSMNGTPPPEGHPVSLALIAYISWISQGQPMGQRPEWLGENRLPAEARIAMAVLDPDEGRAIYERECVMCHGLDGQGVSLPQGRPGPLWGPGSWNDGAGAARPWTLAGFIRWAMPLTEPGSLSDREAQLVAAYINRHDRPVYPTKARDYPAGGRPADAVYDTLVFATHPFRAATAPLSSPESFNQ